MIVSAPTTNGGGGNGTPNTPNVPVPVPTVQVPELPGTSVPPVDAVLTEAQAIAQCVADGLNQVLNPAAFAQCVEDYMTP